MSHSNISIFVPHLGCPHQCSFCNQSHITGQNHQPTSADIHNAVSIAVSSSRYDPTDCEIAFFGGSFTAIDRDYMIELLEVAHQYILKGCISGIRISTRPDCISEDILTVLSDYGVTAIELGAQSMVDEVLIANKRGHLSKDVVFASRLIKSFGFELGLQMMTGLYNSTDADDVFTAKSIIELKPDTVRIYPTIVVKNTELANLWNRVEYIPQDLDKAVSLAVKLEDMFRSSNIKVIRIGLHTLDKDAYVAGPWHPAFRELCDAERFRVKLDTEIKKKGTYNVLVNPYDLSKFIGQKRSNINYFKAKGINLKVLPDLNIISNKFVIKEVK